MTRADDAGADRADPSTTDAGVLSRFRSICAGWPEVDEAELQGRPLFRVRRRRFAIFNAATAPARPRWRGFGRSLHFLAEPGEHAALRQDPRFEASPHHGAHRWLALDLDRADVDWDEVAELLEAGYRQAAGRSLVELLDRSRPAD